MLTKNKFLFAQLNTFRCFSVKIETKPQEPQEAKTEPTEPAEKKFNYSKINFYDLLGVNTIAKDAELKRAYLKLAKKYHPDIYQGVN